jgi:hypothetical protein
MTKTEKHATIVNAGRSHLASQLRLMLDAGECWYVAQASKSNMSATVKLSYCAIVDGKPTIKAIWPGIPDNVWTETCQATGLDYSAVLDIVAKDWGFSYDKRAWKVGGCGFNRVQHVLGNLAWLAFPGDENAELRRRVESISKNDLA